jgi:uncharacterized lipoprotein
MPYIIKNLTAPVVAVFALCLLSACATIKSSAAGLDNDFYYVPAAGISASNVTPGIEAF